MLDRVAGDIAAARALPTLPPWPAPRECGEDDPAAFTDGVTRILDYLAAGAVFQSYLSRGRCARFEAELVPALLPELLREATPAAFSGLFAGDGLEAVSSAQTGRRCRRTRVDAKIALQ